MIILFHLPESESKQLYQQSKCKYLSFKLDKKNFKKIQFLQKVLLKILLFPDLIVTISYWKIKYHGKNIYFRNILNLVNSFIWIKKAMVSIKSEIYLNAALNAQFFFFT